MRRALLLLAKASTSVLLLYLSLRWVNVSVLIERLSRIEVGWIALALFLMVAQVALLAARWQTVAGACGANLHFKRALQFSFIATFFNQVLPSTIGGDGARIWLLARRESGWASAIYSVLIDRIAGVFVLALVVIACLPWTFLLIPDLIPRMVLLVIGFGTVTGALIFIMVGVWFPHSFDHWILLRHLSAASRITAMLCNSLPFAAIVFASSVTIQLLTVAAAWCCIKTVAAPVSFTQLLFLLPPILLIATVPVSIAGWGVRETTMMAAFAYAGLAQSDGLALSILVGGMSFAIGVIGGIVWIVSGLRLRSFGEARGALKPVSTRN